MTQKRLRSRKLIPQAHLGPIPRTQRQGQILLPRARIPTLQHRKLLRQPDRHIPCLSQRVLLSHADTRAPVERKILPSRAKVRPALRPELVRIRAVNVLAAVHRPHAVRDDSALGDEHGGLAVRPAADGEDGVGDGEAGVSRDDGVQTEGLSVLALFFSFFIFIFIFSYFFPPLSFGDSHQSWGRLRTFVQTILDIGQIPQLLVRGRPAVQRGHLVAQPGPDARVLGQHEEEVTQQRGGGVATRQKDIHDLIADPAAVARLLRQAMQEHVSRFLLAVPIFEGLLVDAPALRPHLERLVDELLHQRVADAIAPLHLAVAVESSQRAQPDARGDRMLRVVECAGEVVLGVRVAAAGAALLQALHALAEEELGGRVDGVAEEEVLEVDGAAVVGDQLQQIGHLRLEDGEVGHLFADEVGADHGARLRPVLAVGGEDAMAEEGAEGLVPVAQRVVLEPE